MVSVSCRNLSALTTCFILFGCDNLGLNLPTNQPTPAAESIPAQNPIAPETLPEQAQTFSPKREVNIDKLTKGLGIQPIWPVNIPQANTSIKTKNKIQINQKMLITDIDDFFVLSDIYQGTGTSFSRYQYLQTVTEDDKEKAAEDYDRLLTSGLLGDDAYILSDGLSGNPMVEASFEVLSVASTSVVSGYIAMDAGHLREESGLYYDDSIHLPMQFSEYSELFMKGRYWNSKVDNPTNQFFADKQVVSACFSHYRTGRYQGGSSWEAKPLQYNIGPRHLHLKLGTIFGNNSTTITDIQACYISRDEALEIVNTQMINAPGRYSQNHQLINNADFNGGYIVIFQGGDEQENLSDPWFRVVPLDYDADCKLGGIYSCLIPTMVDVLYEVYNPLSINSLIDLPALGDSARFVLLLPGIVAGMYLLPEITSANILGVMLAGNIDAIMSSGSNTLLRYQGGTFYLTPIHTVNNTQLNNDGVVFMEQADNQFLIQGEDVIRSYQDQTPLIELISPLDASSPNEAADFGIRVNIDGKKQYTELPDKAMIDISISHDEMQFDRVLIHRRDCITQCNETHQFRIISASHWNQTEDIRDLLEEGNNELSVIIRNNMEQVFESTFTITINGDTTNNLIEDLSPIQNDSSDVDVHPEDTTIEQPAVTQSGPEIQIGVLDAHQSLRHRGQGNIVLELPVRITGGDWDDVNLSLTNSCGADMAELGDGYIEVEGVYDCDINYRVSANGQYVEGDYHLNSSPGFPYQVNSTESLIEDIRTDKIPFSVGAVSGKTVGVDTDVVVLQNVNIKNEGINNLLINLEGDQNNDQYQICESLDSDNHEAIICLEEAWALNNDAVRVVLYGGISANIFATSPNGIAVTQGGDIELYIYKSQFNDRSGTPDRLTLIKEDDYLPIKGNINTQKIHNGLKVTIPSTNLDRGRYRFWFKVSSDSTEAILKFAVEIQ